MFKAMGRFFRAVGYLVTGRMDKYRETLMKDPNAMRAAYDGVAEEKTARIQQYKEAVAGMIAQREKKRARAQSLTAEIEKLERLKTGARAKAQRRVRTLQGQGLSKAKVQSDEEYRKCSAAYKDFSSSLADAEERMALLETDLEEQNGRIRDHKIQIQSLLRDLTKLRDEREDAVADVISAKEEQEVADMLAGISEDGTAKELETLRSVRERAKAEAQISKELAGTDTRAQEAEFLEFARAEAAHDEFDTLIEFAEDTDVAAGAAEAPRQTEHLPE